MSAAGPRVAIVGGGISGLAAAFHLRDRLPSARITVYEQASSPGGKLRTGELAGVDGNPLRVEAGAESILLHGPDGEESAAVTLARRVGLGDELVHPATGAAAVAVTGRLRPLPAGTLMGVPGDLSTLDGVARPAAELDRDGDRPLLEPGEDVAVGALVRRRLGDEVVDRLVDPLLGGVYAGRADGLSLAATVPLLADACRSEHTLVGAVRAAQRASRRPVGPVFTTVRSGLSTLVDAVIAELARNGTTIHYGLPIRELQRTEAGWRLLRGTAGRPEAHEADAVVLALPAHRAIRLLAEVAPAAAAALGRVEYASIALVNLALPAVELPELSGFLVPATEGRAVKAATFFTRKWAHYRRPDGTVLVRASLGRIGEERVLQADDAELVALVRRELAAMLGPLPAPVDTAVTRWGGGLPQYPPGHLDRVTRAQAALPRGLALAGAGYAGVGIAACVASGLAAADKIAAALKEYGP